MTQDLFTEIKCALLITHAFRTCIAVRMIKMWLPDEQQL